MCSSFYLLKDVEGDTLDVQTSSVRLSEICSCSLNPGVARFSCIAPVG